MRENAGSPAIHSQNKLTYGFPVFEPDDARPKKDLTAEDRDPFEKPILPMACDDT